MTTKRHHALRKEKVKTNFSELRGSMATQAEKILLPKRFETNESVDTPSIWITDKTTGKTTQIPLFAYRAVREALNDLFE